MKIYTRRGDDGTTGLLYGGRVPKNAPRPVAYGAVDEAQAAIGIARAASSDPELNDLLVTVGRDLYVAMAELATAEGNRDKLVAGETLVVASMVDRLEAAIDSTTQRFDMPTEFVVPGGSVVAASLDVARTVVRRAECDALAVVGPESVVIAYLNRLSDLLWALARWQEDTATMARSPH